MEQNNKTDIWKIIVISLAASAIVAVGVVFLVKYIKKKKAKKEVVLEWDDEEDFERCMNGNGEAEILVLNAE